MYNCVYFIHFIIFQLCYINNRKKINKGGYNMSRLQFSFQTSDQVKINAYRWQPDSDIPIVGIVQIAHGMVEHILRYDPFCHFLTTHGLVVYGNDHRGHGHSISAPDDRGYFADKNGFELVVDDMLRLSAIAQNEYPSAPLFLFGHSMGSFLTRRYMAKYRDKLRGVILSGTGGDQGIIGKIGYLLATVEKHRIGARTPSLLLDKLIFRNFNKLFDNPRTPYDFLTRDEAVVDEYIHDDLCGYTATAGFYADLIYGNNLVNTDEQVARIPKDLPIFLIAGDKDPVGNQGKGVREVYEQYKRHNLHVSMKLYEGARHELLHEWNKADVYEDILNWLKEIMKGVKSWDTKFIKQ